MLEICPFEQYRPSSNSQNWLLGILAPRQARPQSGRRKLGQMHEKDMMSSGNLAFGGSKSQPVSGI